MRKLVLTLLLAVSITGLYAQKLDDVKEKLDKQKFGEAKEKIDKVLADPKNQGNSEAWFLKARTYYGLSKTSPDALAESLQALKKYVELEQQVKLENMRMLLSTLDKNHSTLIAVYTDYANMARKDFHDAKYDVALKEFKYTFEAFDLLNKAKLVNFQMDTLNTLIAGFAAQNVKNYDDATMYYQKIIDAKISDTIYTDAYRFMIYHNLTNKKDTAEAIRYLELSENLFPKYEDLWVEFETLAMGNDREKKMARYQVLTQRFPNNAFVALNYGIEVYNDAFFSETKSANYVQEKENARKALEKALSLDPNSEHGNFVMSQYYLMQTYDVDDTIRTVKGTTPADVAKKKELNARLDVLYEGMFNYSQKAHDLYAAREANLKGQDKANYRKVINQMIDYYSRKKQTDKVTFYQDKLKTLK